MGNRIINFDDVLGNLSKGFPGFEVNEDSKEIGIYIVAGDFTRYLLECYKSGSFDEIQKAFDFIESLFVWGDDKTKELAVVGFLENIQNIWANNGVDPEKIFEMLGVESKKWWKELNKLWQGEIKYLGETIDRDN